MAESCFWLNRYVERVEVLSRLLDVNLSFQLDVDLGETARWRPLVVVTGQEEHFLEQTPISATDDADTVLEYLTWNQENPASVISSLRMARENARTIRETISLEMWETINDTWVWLGERPARRLYEKERHAFFRELINQCLLVHGLAQATMLHQDPFEFMRLGTALERAGQTARILDIKHHSIGSSSSPVDSPEEALQWIATLRSCSGVEPFLKIGERTLTGRTVAEFLIFEPTFPRSIIHNLVRARNFLKLVRHVDNPEIGLESYQALTRLLDRVKAMSIETVVERGLHVVLTELVDGTIEIGSKIHRDFFDPVVPGTEASEQGA